MVNAGEVSAINSYVFGGISICLNSFLISVICYRSVEVMGSYKYMMITSAILDLLFSALFIVACPNEKGFDSPFNIVQSKTMLITSIYLIIMMVSALSIMLYCTKRIMIAARAGSNEKTRKLQMQLYKTLIAQVE
ncbi:hypothetical protein NECAME_16757 [Necator americanus]|uniref:G-protein coupled receptors family 1 profile domain-containing protein n=1 Tax=Necator americanus TaxID=51031 RepID=W2TTR0_NECAM|nr:hypothetical protein NECAME_16757 [Necator americanus]ETN85460.1 hypothetical protein NECAME_16757 [Necator americanus]